MHGLGLLQIAVFLAAAAIAAPLAKKLKIGSVLGYLIAGFLIGPYGLGIAIYQLYDVKEIQHIAEFGVVLLLFLIGLELRPKRIWAMRSSIFVLGGAQVAISAMFLSSLALVFAYPAKSSLFIGLSLALSSTAFALQVLEEKKELTTVHGRKAFSVLLFQDLAAIPLIALVPLFAMSPPEGGGMDLFSAMTALAIIVSVIVFGHFALNHIFRLVAKTEVREAMTASALLTVIGVALAMEHAGLSAAMGAFIAGVILADSEYRHQIEADIEPFSGLLLGLFFTTIGMSLDIYVLRDEFQTVLLIALGLVAIKFSVIYLLGRWRGLLDAQARRFAIVLSQGGEFAFVLLTAGAAVNVLEPEQAKLFTLAVTISMVTTPLLLLLDDLANARNRGAEAVKLYDKPRGAKGHIVIAGLGRFGQIIARIMIARRLPFTALDIDGDLVEGLKQAGYTGYYGDASRLNILRAVRTDKASGFVVAVEDVEQSLKIVRLVRRHYPDLTIYARARDRKHVHQLIDLGAQVIRRETFLCAVEITRDVLIKAFGEEAGKVDEDLKRFKEFDRRQLYDDYRQGSEAEKRAARTRPTAAELEELFTQLPDVADGKAAD